MGEVGGQGCVAKVPVDVESKQNWVVAGVTVDGGDEEVVPLGGAGV